jgi:5-methylcytosine-specific restriction endonuclease McrA
VPNDPFYHSAQWRHLRARALDRDGHTCTVKGCRDKATHVDHIKRRKDGGADALHNLRSLCKLHDGQVKEMANGKRANGGKFKIIGCGPDGWPLGRQGT